MASSRSVRNLPVVVLNGAQHPYKDEAWLHVVYDGMCRSVYVNNVSHAQGEAEKWLLPFLEDPAMSDCNHIDIDAISRNYKGYKHQVPQTITPWHPKYIDLRDLVNCEAQSPYSFVANYRPLPLRPLGRYDDFYKREKELERNANRVMIRIAFGYEGLEEIKIETQIHQKLDRTGCTLKFLGHVHEKGRIIGMALQYPERFRSASLPDDGGKCQRAISKIHRHGYAHLSITPDSFIIAGTTARLVNWGHAQHDNDPEIVQGAKVNDSVDLREICLGLQLPPRMKHWINVQKRATACWTPPFGQLTNAPPTVPQPILGTGEFTTSEIISFQYGLPPV